MVDLPLNNDLIPNHEDRRGRPRSDEKNHDIMNAAVQLFLEGGYAGTSMDKVAKCACVSKQTVYSHFSSKEALFAAAVSHKIQEYFPEAVLEAYGELPLKQELTKVVRHFSELLLGEEGIAMFRVLVGSVHKDSQLAEIFWANGPQQMLAHLSGFLKFWADKGELAIDDLTEASMTLVMLMKGNLHFMRSIGLIDEVPAEVYDQHAEKTAESFLKLYRP